MPAKLDVKVTLLRKKLRLVALLKDLGVHMEPDLSSDEHTLTIASFACRVYVSTVLK